MIITKVLLRIVVPRSVLLVAALRGRVPRSVLLVAALRGAVPRSVLHVAALRGRVPSVTSKINPPIFRNIKSPLLYLTFFIAFMLENGLSVLHSVACSL